MKLIVVGFRFMAHFCDLRNTLLVRFSK